MNVLIDKNLSKKEVDEILKKIDSAGKPFDAKKYFGKSKIEGDPLQIQQEMRDE